ncbi:MAG: hypothetical protein R3F59_25175 [Myxococcota bacterium]
MTTNAEMPSTSDSAVASPDSELLVPSSVTSVDTPPTVTVTVPVPSVFALLSATPSDSVTCAWASWSTLMA